MNPWDFIHPTCRGKPESRGPLVSSVRVKRERIYFGLYRYRKLDYSGAEKKSNMTSGDPWSCVVYVGAASMLEREWERERGEEKDERGKTVQSFRRPRDFSRWNTNGLENVELCVYMGVCTLLTSRLTVLRWSFAGWAFRSSSHTGVVPKKNIK